MRKVIQIVIDDGDLFALCNDGSLWRWMPCNWIRFQDIPQDAPETEDLENKFSVTGSC